MRKIWVILQATEEDEQSPYPHLSLSLSFNFITNIRQLNVIRSILYVLGRMKASKMFEVKD